jgi:superfamily I DNA/RNA helicase
VRGRSFLLRTNWRNTQAIADAAEAVIGDLAFGDLGDDVAPRPAADAPLPLRLGAPPQLHLVRSPATEEQVLCVLVADALATVSPGDIAVLGRTNKVWRRAERALLDAGHPVAGVRDYGGEHVDAIRVGTFLGAKGLEWKVVVLCGVTRGEWRVRPYWLKEDGDVAEHNARELRTFFVAMTRARDRLALISAGNLPEEIERATDRFDVWEW